MTRHTPGDDIDHTLATYLIDGLNINCNWVSGTSLARIPDSEGSGYRATIELHERATIIQYMSRLGWFEAAEGAVRQVVWCLNKSDDGFASYCGGSQPEVS